MSSDDHEDFLQIWRERFCYKYDVFISYSTEQHAEAKALYEQLSPDLKTFFAPVSLKDAEQTPNQFVDVLQDALVQSCQVVVLLSSSYIKSSWCLLEMHGYFNLLRRDRKRGMSITPIEPVTDQLIGQLIPFIRHADDIVNEIRKTAQSAEIFVGDQFADHEFPRMFVELPLRQFYEPPKASNRPPWGKDDRSPHGMPGAPDYTVYELLVREYMVQIMRGHVLNQLEIPVIGVQERYLYMTDDAKNDAERMIQLGVSPFQGTYTRNLGDWLRDIKQARRQGQDSAELDCLEGAARAKAGFFDDGIKLMKQCLDMDKQSHDYDYYLMQIAFAEYLAGRFEKAIETLEGLEEPLTKPAALIHAASLARLKRLSESDMVRNKNSDVRVNEIRIDSDVERREDLDFWAEGLELAGFQR